MNNAPQTPTDYTFVTEQTFSECHSQLSVSNYANRQAQRDSGGKHVVHI